jgi:hypothetical protein
MGRRASETRRRFAGITKERKEKVKNQGEISSQAKAVRPDVPKK